MKLYMFRTVPLSIIMSFSLYSQQWFISYRFPDSLRAGAYATAFIVRNVLAGCISRKEWARPPPPLFFVCRFEKRQNVANYALTECAAVYRRVLIFETSHSSFLNHRVQIGCTPSYPPVRRVTRPFLLG